MAGVPAMPVASKWRMKPLSMQIDHVNGDRKDGRLENVRILCPNCHSQTPTFGGKNKNIGLSSKGKTQGSDP